MDTGIVKLVEEGGKILALVDPFQVTTREGAASFYETVLVACIKEMNRRGLGDTVPFLQPEPLFPEQHS